MGSISDILAFIGAVVIISTPLAKGLKAAADKFQEHAVGTPGKEDDKWAMLAVTWSGRLSGALEWAAGMLPVVSKGARGDRE